MDLINIINKYIKNDGPIILDNNFSIYDCIKFNKLHNKKKDNYCNYNEKNLLHIYKLFK